MNRTKVSFVNGLCIHRDAISSALRFAFLALEQNGRYHPKLYAYANDYSELACKQVTGIGEIVLDRHFQGSECVYLPYGIFSPLFNLLPVLPKNVAAIVRFHNITPPQHVRATDRLLIEQSFQQLSNIAFASHVLCDSAVNREVLIEHGLGDIPATVMPLPIVRSGDAPAAKPSFADGVVKIAFVGRIVQSKGVLDLVTAAKRAIALLPGRRIDIDIIGNLRISDQAYVERVRTAAATCPAGLVMRFAGSVTDVEKVNILRAADLFVLPSYHEGFCVPVLEAFDAGCRVVTYDNSNLPSIADGLSRLVPTGDIDALTRAIVEEAGIVRSPRWREPNQDGYVGYTERTSAYLLQYSAQTVGDRFVEVVDGILDTRKGA